MTTLTFNLAHRDNKSPQTWAVDSCPGFYLLKSAAEDLGFRKEQSNSGWGATHGGHLVQLWRLTSKADQVRTSSRTEPAEAHCAPIPVSNYSHFCISHIFPVVHKETPQSTSHLQKSRLFHTGVNKAKIHGSRATKRFQGLGTVGEGIRSTGYFFLSPSSYR